MMLRRFAYPCRYSDMVARFARPVPVIFMITNRVVDYIYEMHSHRIINWNNDLLNPNNLLTCAEAINAKGAALENCFGLIDGTVRPVCRPGQHQRMLYNGHKRVHAIKFQALAIPNGLITNLNGPYGKSGLAWFFFYTD